MEQPEPGPQLEPKTATQTVADLWGSALGRTLRMLVSMPFFFAGLPMKLAIFLLACLVVVIFVLIVYAVIYLLMHTHMRLPLPSHSSRMDRFMGKMSADLLAALTDFSDGCKQRCFVAGGMTTLDYCVARNDSMEKTTSCDAGGAGAGLADLQGTADRLRQAVDALLDRWQTKSSDEEMATYFSFYKEIAKYNCLSKYDIKSNAPELCVEGDIEDGLVQEFVKGVVRPMSSIEQVAEELSDKLDALPGLPNMRRWGALDYKVASAVHKMRLLTSYKEAVHFMQKTRRKKMHFAIWTQYYWPYVQDIYEHRIPEVWLKTGPNYVQYIKSGLTWWGGVGVKIGLMPCNMAFPDPEERMEKCRARDVTGKEMFSQESVTTEESTPGDGTGGMFPWLDDKEAKKRRWIAKRDKQRAARLQEQRHAGQGDETEGYEASPDVVETVSITGALGAITNFILNIKYVGIAIARFGQQFPTDPFGTIIGIISLIVGVILGLVFMILYMILTFTGSFWLLLCVWGIVLTFVTAILYTLYQFQLSILMAIPYLWLWLIDLPTGGLVSRMLRCENLPDDWADLPNFADENVYRRMAFMCFKPCSARFTPIGCLCKRRKIHMPDYCPQQQIYRAFAGKGIKGGMTRYDAPFALEKYHPVAGFGRLSLQRKQKTIISVYRDKMEWYQKCYASLEDYDYINRHVCRNVALVPGLSDEQQRKLSTLCRENYCDYRPTSGLIGGIKSGIKATMTGEDEAKGGAMCGALYGKKKEEEKEPDDSSLGGPGTALLRRVLLMLMLVLAALAMFYSMLQASKQMAASIK
jgi:hypothetical protein